MAAVATSAQGSWVPGMARHGRPDVPAALSEASVLRKGEHAGHSSWCEALPRGVETPQVLDRCPGSLQHGTPKQMG